MASPSCQILSRASQSDDNTQQQRSSQPSPAPAVRLQHYRYDQLLYSVAQLARCDRHSSGTPGNRVLPRGDKRGPWNGSQRSAEWAKHAAAATYTSATSPEQLQGAAGAVGLVRSSEYLPPELMPSLAACIGADIAVLTRDARVTARDDRHCSSGDSGV
jgi:hypothetical protein